MAKPSEPDTGPTHDDKGSQGDNPRPHAEQHQVRVDMDSIRLLDEPDEVAAVEVHPDPRISQVDALWDVEDSAADESSGKVPSSPIVAPIPQPRIYATDELPVLGPKHELSDEEIPVLGPEHELSDDEVAGQIPSARVVAVRAQPLIFESESPPVLGPEHELRDEELPVLGAEHEIAEEAIPVLGPEHEVRDEELPVLGAEHEVVDEAIPVLGPEHEVQDDELPVLGPEHEVRDDQPAALGDEPAIPEESVADAPSPGDDPDLAVMVPDRESSAEGAGEEAEKPTAEAEPEPEAPSDQEAPEPEELPADEETDQPADEPSEADDEASRNYRQIYENELRHLERDARVAMAHTAENPILLALCLDPDPQVINAVFQNTLAGLDHARMAAFHHKNPVGLEFIVKRADFLRDTQVQRQLLRNNQMTESLMRRVLASKPLREVYKVCVNRDVPDRSRVWSRGILRSRFSSAQSDERADFVTSTEGRCLTFLVGVTFDSRMTTILCGRQYNSVIFIQNLARFPACPPALLVHLLKQPFVRRHQALKKMIFQHPNLPSQAKRNL